MMMVPALQVSFVMIVSSRRASDATQAIALVNSGKHPVTEGEVRT